MKEIETFCPTNRNEWRQWLSENHSRKQSIWLVYYKKKANIQTISYNDAVDEALCFGWIDSTAKSLDNDRYMQYFCKRKKNGTWSKVNKNKIIQLIDSGLMTKAGLDVIEAAKQNGSWEILDTVEELIIPDDLEIAFSVHEEAKDFFLSLSNSVKKFILFKLISAKRPETRQKRIDEIITFSTQKIKPKIQ